MKPNHREANPSRFENNPHLATGSPNSSRGDGEVPLFEVVRPSKVSSFSSFEADFSEHYECRF